LRRYALGSRVTVRVVLGEDTKTQNPGFSGSSARLAPRSGEDRRTCRGLIRERYDEPSWANRRFGSASGSCRSTSRSSPHCTENMLFCMCTTREWSVVQALEVKESSSPGYSVRREHSGLMSTPSSCSRARYRNCAGTKANSTNRWPEADTVMVYASSCESAMPGLSTNT